MPGTARLLSLFALTLAESSEGCNFVLVPNGCEEAEKRLLMGLAARNERFDYLDASFDYPVHHAIALEHLLSLERGERFCFLDTDILADGDWLPTVKTATEIHVGVFGCPPIWARREDQVQQADWKRLGGRYNVTDNGMVLGGTYLAVYDVEPLRSVLKEGASFSRARWQMLPATVHAKLEAIQMKKDGYDTGKVVNLLLTANGHSLANVDLPNLHHIGGVSIVAQAADATERRAANFSVSIAERSSIERRLSGRQLSNEYVGSLMRHLFDGDAHPGSPATGDTDLDARLQSLGELIASAYDRHSLELAKA
jgi:hypothetical protein